MPYARTTELAWFRRLCRLAVHEAGAACGMPVEKGGMAERRRSSGKAEKGGMAVRLRSSGMVSTASEAM